MVFLELEALWNLEADADPDSAFHFDAETDPGPTFQSDAEPDPVPTSHFFPEMTLQILHSLFIRIRTLPFQSDADPNLASQNDADLFPQHCLKSFIEVFKKELLAFFNKKKLIFPTGEYRTCKR
jgi:hypothetical protein